MPLIPFVDVAGNTGTGDPAQMVNEVPKPKVGVRFGFTVTEIVVASAHCPASGVKVYVPEDWLSMAAGLQLPVMLLVDVVGKRGAVPPSHIIILVPKLKDGVRLELTVTVNVVVVAQGPPADGVNV